MVVDYKIRTQDPELIIIDLFCGAGGTSTGFEMAEDEIAMVVAAVNHDPKAIVSHWKNHPEVEHFEEDITMLYGFTWHGILFKSPNFKRLVRLVDMYRAFYPNAKIILWASLECTNFSKAKGGQPRDADSRTLADHMHPYVIALDPDYIEIENVVEFMSWGPLDDKGKPISRKNGTDYMRWCREVCSHGYYDEWKELNSADFGAYTSRNRLFGIFAKHDHPIIWPEATHSKNPNKGGLFSSLLKWKPVKDVLDFDDEGKSIFDRPKALSDKTLERIYAGLLKYVAKGDSSFISKYFSGRPKGKVNSIHDPASTITTVANQAIVQTKNFSDVSVDNPIGAITTIDHHALVQANFILKYNSTNGKTGKHNPPSVNEPSPVVSCQGRLGLVQPQFLAAYYGNGDNVSSVENPCPTIPTKDRFGIVQPQYFIDKHYGKSSQNQSIDQPAGVIMPNDKHRLVEAQPFIMPTNYDNGPKSIDEPSPTITANRKHHYIVNPSHGGNNTSTDAPCPVIVARQDKAPLYLVQAEPGRIAVAVYEGDSDIMIKIKEFMVIYELVDIKMRMLKVIELKLIQGFPSTYVLEGNQADQKKFIGNSVHPFVPKAMAEALVKKLRDFKLKVA